MLDHVSITVTDLPRAARFYDAVMAALRVPCVNRSDQAIGYGIRNRADDDSHSYISIRASNGPIHADRRHWCFRAPDRAAVDAFHAAGVAQGGQDDGGPGLRTQYHPHYYAAFLLDPDGNRVEAVCHHEAFATTDLDLESVTSKAGSIGLTIDLGPLAAARRLDGNRPPPPAYVYVYVETPEFSHDGALCGGRPLYVGRGSGTRVFNQGRHAREWLAGKPQLGASGRLNFANLPWKTHLGGLISVGSPWCIVIVADGMTMDDAKTLERRLIDHFGKRSSGAGILFNVG